MVDVAAELGRALAREFRRRMADEYVPRIASCVARLTEEQVWSAPGPHCNSIGNLLVHLEGNVRQWVLSGLAGRPDRRDRDAEFRATRATAPAPPAALVARLRSTVEEAVGVVEGLGPAELLAVHRFQSRYEETGTGAVVHVLEHFSGHAGQIYALTKQLAGVDLRHYDL